MKNCRCLVKCITYKDAFILRRALIDLGYNDRHLLDLYTWNKLWNEYHENTVFRIDEDDIGYSHKDFYKDNFYYIKKHFLTLSINEFVKKYIRQYE